MPMRIGTCAVLGAAVCAIVVGTAATMASADAAQVKSPSLPLYKTYVWNTKRNAVPQQRSVASSGNRTHYVQRYYNGRSAYICSPSGSGMRSRCFSR